MAKTMKMIEQAESAREISPVEATAYRITGPWRIEAFPTTIKSIPAGFVLLKPMWTGICAADLRYTAGRRPPEVLSEKLPLAPFHEGVAEVLEVGPGVEDFSSGDQVVVVPNIPCYVHDPITYPSREEACPACRPGGAGENYCMDVAFLASTVDGLAQTSLLHPAWGLIKLPDEVPAKVAALTEPISVAVTAGKEAAPLAEGRIFVLGAGVIGFITALVLSKAFGVEKERLVVTDVRQRRLEAVKAFAGGMLAKDVNGMNSYWSSAARVFECAGGQAAHRTVPQATKLLMPGGVCMLLGVTEGPVPVQTRPLLDKGLMLRGTTRSTKEDMAEAVELLRREEFAAAVQTVLYPETFAAESPESILHASQVADDTARYGRVLLRW